MQARSKLNLAPEQGVGVQLALAMRLGVTGRFCSKTEWFWSSIALEKGLVSNQ
jgi:hypothetical protein